MRNIKLERKNRENKHNNRASKTRFRKWLFFSKLLVTITILVVFVKLYYSLGNFSDHVKNYIYSITADLGYRVKNVYLEGHRFSNKDDIDKILNLRIDQPILAVDINNLRDKLEKTEWIKHAVIDRQLPDTLYIGIVERNVIALGQHNKKLHLIDEDGSIIKTNNIKPFLSLPIIIGDGAEIHASNILILLKKDPDIYKRITSIIRISERRWNVILDNMLEIKLPEGNPEEAWNTIIKLNKEHNLLANNNNAIDLRINGKLYIEKNK
jgi:cell division protein FtsQ